MTIKENPKRNLFYEWMAFVLLVEGTLGIPNKMPLPSRSFSSSCVFLG